MSRSKQGHPWCHERRDAERPLPEPRPLPQIPLSEERCGGHCGEESDDQVAELLRLAVCPSVEDLVAVFYGEASEALEKWVDAHIKVCDTCKWEMEALVRSEEDDE